MPDDSQRTEGKGLRFTKAVKPPCCGFCGKQGSEVFCIILAGSTLICDECIDLLASVVAKKRSEEPHPNIWCVEFVPAFSMADFWSPDGAHHEESDQQ